MFIILAYDVKQKRTSKVNKITKKYLHPVQRSVFEGKLTESELKALKRELHSAINTDEDSVKIYKLDSIRYAEADEIGTPPMKKIFLL